MTAATDSSPRTPGRTFRSLHIEGYRWFAAGALVTNIAVWMQRIAQDWLVIEVTGSPLAVGITTALQFLPVLLAGPFFGSFADRWPKKRQIVIAGTVMGIAALGLGLIIVTGLVTEWYIFGVALLLGLGSAADGPVRQAFVRELVPRAYLTNAIGLNGASFHSARIIGPAIAGLMIGWLGTGPVFLLVGVCTMGALLTLLKVHPAEGVWEVPGPVVTPGISGVPLEDDEALEEAGLIAGRERAKGLRGAWRHLKQQPVLLVIMGLAGAVCAFSLNFQVTITLMATTVFGLGAGQFGLLSTVMAVGSITGALLAARREVPTYQLVVGAAIVLGLLYAVAGYLPTVWLFTIAMLPIGLVSNTFMTSANASVQLRIEPEYQGRVMALYIAASNAFVPLGSPLIGLIAQFTDARVSMLVAGLVAVAAGLAAVVVLTRMGVFHRRTVFRTQGESA